MADSVVSLIMGVGKALEDGLTAKVDSLRPDKSSIASNFTGNIRANSKNANSAISRGMRKVGVQDAVRDAAGLVPVGAAALLGTKGKNGPKNKKIPGGKGNSGSIPVYHRNPMQGVSFQGQNLVGPGEYGFDPYGRANDDSLLNAMDAVSYGTLGNTYGMPNAAIKNQQLGSNLMQMANGEKGFGKNNKDAVYVGGNQFSRRNLDDKQLSNMKSGTDQALRDVRSANNVSRLGNAVSRASALQLGEDGMPMPSALTKSRLSDEEYEYGITKSVSTAGDGFPAFVTQYKKDKANGDIVAFMTSGVSSNGLRTTTFSKRDKNDDGQVFQDDSHILSNSTTSLSDVLDRRTSKQPGFSQNNHIGEFKGDFVGNAQRKTSLYDFAKGYPTGSRGVGTEKKQNVVKKGMPERTSQRNQAMQRRSQDISLDAQHKRMLQEEQNRQKRSLQQRSGHIVQQRGMDVQSAVQKQRSVNKRPLAGTHMSPKQAVSPSTPRRRDTRLRDLGTATTPSTPTKGVETLRRHGTSPQLSKRSLGVAVPPNQPGTLNSGQIRRRQVHPLHLPADFKKIKGNDSKDSFRRR